jgi:hypothetical protein
MEVRAQRLKPEEQLSLDAARRIADEICVLSRAQRDALQKAPYILMSRAEREAYDRRRDHIKELGELLAKFMPEDADIAD